MKRIERFVCEYCNTEYADEMACANCEKHHHKPVEIKAKRYLSYGRDKSGMPTWITVTMDDGAEVVYKRQ